jgi:hypothetical protein
MAEEIGEDQPILHVCTEISASDVEREKLSALVWRCLKNHRHENLTVELVCTLFVTYADEFSVATLTNFVKRFYNEERFISDENNEFTLVCVLFAHATTIGDIPLLVAILDACPGLKDRLIIFIFTDVCRNGLRAAAEYFADLVRLMPESPQGNPRFADRLVGIVDTYSYNEDIYRDRVAIAALYVDAMGIEMTDLKSNTVVVIEKYRQSIPLGPKFAGKI